MWKYVEPTNRLIRALTPIKSIQHITSNTVSGGKDVTIDSVNVNKSILLLNGATSSTIFLTFKTSTTVHIDSGAMGNISFTVVEFV